MRTGKGPEFRSCRAKSRHGKTRFEDMSLRVAVQMDPLESINIAGDSSFALMLAAQVRGHSVWHYDVASLSYDSGRITAWAAPVTVQRVVGDHFSVGERRRIDLATDI